MQFDTWDEFVAVLSHCDWSRSDDELYTLVRPILQRVNHNTGIVQERIEQIRSTPTLFESLKASHLYPRMLLERLQLYADPAERFVIRMHRFHAAHNTGGAKEKIHNHKFPGFTLVLKGEYIEENFSYEDVDLDSRTCRVWSIGTEVLKAGDINAKHRATAHRVRNLHTTASCYTLFIRGPLRDQHGLMFDEVTQTCWPWLGSNQTLEKAFDIFASLSDEFM